MVSFRAGTRQRAASRPQRPLPWLRTWQARGRQVPASAALPLCSSWGASSLLWDPPLLPSLLHHPACCCALPSTLPTSGLCSCPVLLRSGQSWCLLRSAPRLQQEHGADHSVPTSRGALLSMLVGPNSVLRADVSPLSCALAGRGNPWPRGHALRSKSRHIDSLAPSVHRTAALSRRNYTRPGS